MRLCIPSETDEGPYSIRSGHFGHAPFFTIIVIDDEDQHIVGYEVAKNVDHDEYGCGGVIDYALSLNIDAMVTVGMGMPPLMRFTQAGVKVYSERETPYVGDVTYMFLEGKLDLMDPSMACEH